jgi:hypothetical protein
VDTRGACLTGGGEELMDAEEVAALALLYRLAINVARGLAAGSNTRPLFSST